MEEKRIRIVDIAQELGVSTVTVSNVIHGKTKKISAATVERVQCLLEEREYIPSMAGMLLAQNDSRIIGIMINDPAKYEGRVLQDPFVYGSLDYLQESIQSHGYEMMLKLSCDCEDVVRYASMWNMSGLIMIGFCEQDYEKIRGRMHIPLVVYDGFFKETKRFGNVSIDNWDGGRQMGEYLAGQGHRKLLFLSDNAVCMDQERFDGFRGALEREGIPAAPDMFRLIPATKRERMNYYGGLLTEIGRYTAAFCASDSYAVELIDYLADHGIRAGRDFSVAGFDDIPLAAAIRPTLTTVRQDLRERAVKAMELIELQRNGTYDRQELSVCLPVRLVVRDTVVSV